MPFLLLVEYIMGTVMRYQYLDIVAFNYKKDRYRKAAEMTFITSGFSWGSVTIKAEKGI